MSEKVVYVHFAYDDETPTAVLEELSKSRNGSVFAGLNSAGWPGKGETRILWNDTFSGEGRNILIAGVGAKNAKDYCEIEMLNERRENARVAAGAAVSALKGLKVAKVLMELLPGCETAQAEGAHLAQWRYKETEMEKMPKLIEPIGGAQDPWMTGVRNAKAQNFARYLMESPANLMTPTIFCEKVTERLNPLGIKCTTHGKDFILSERMGAFWSVAKGSEEEPKLLKLEYNGPSNPSGKKICLVGKGVTFDAGGISIKPSANMDAMRADMGGAAVTVSTIYALAMAKAPGNYVALTPLAENMPSGTANKPGDVVTARNGMTIQVDNTDAEGRLLLCDTLVYACDTIKPDVIVDSATLTGAMCIATGWACAGCFTWSGDLATKLTAAGVETGDRIWRMPVFNSHKKKISPAQLADLNNTGPRWGGACNAAAYLRSFVPADGPEYAHLDIAGVMDTCPGSDDPSYISKGMTGRPTRTLAEFCRAYSSSS